MSYTNRALIAQDHFTLIRINRAPPAQLAGRSPELAGSTRDQKSFGIAGCVEPCDGRGITNRYCRVRVDSVAVLRHPAMLVVKHESPVRIRNETQYRNSDSAGKIPRRRTDCGGRIYESG